MTTKRFTGQYHESGLPGGEGLSYYNARWYDAQLARFVSADTIVPDPGDPQALNRLAYALNNPLNYADPDGHDPWWAGTKPGTQHWDPREYVADYLQKSVYPPSYPKSTARSADAVGLYISSPTADVAVHPVGGVEVIYNFHTEDITLFGVLGGEATIGGDLTIAMQFNLIYNIGEDNLNYRGPFLVVNFTGAYIAGVTVGGAYSPTRDEQWWKYVFLNEEGAYSIGAGPAFGAGLSGSAGQVEYIPLLTVRSDGTGTTHAGWYLFEDDQRGFIVDALSVTLQRLGAAYGVDVQQYDWMDPEETIR